MNINIKPKLAKPKHAKPKLAKPKLAKPKIAKPKLAKPKLAKPKLPAYLRASLFTESNPSPNHRKSRHLLTQLHSYLLCSKHFSLLRTFNRKSEL
eukprot:885852-Amorphochlora_amoeboformis.AAC.1